MYLKKQFILREFKYNFDVSSGEQSCSAIKPGLGL